MLLATDASALDFFTFLNTPRHYVLPSLGCLYLLSFLYTWSTGGEWPLSPLGNSLLFRTELLRIQDCRVYFPDSPTDLFALDLFRSWPK